jgi:putative drug exporter of the RND superfamily
MREPHRSVSSETQPPYALAPRPGPGFSPPSRRNLTERVAGWSARHRKTAVFGWLLLVVVIFIAGQAIGSAQLPQYDAGQAGQAEHVLNQVAPAQFEAYDESVLIQAKAPGVTFSSSPAMRQAAREVAAALAAQPQYATGITTPLSASASAWPPPS